MSGNWPLDLGDKNYGAATLEGRNYVSTYPDLLSDWVDTSQDRYTGYSGTVFQPTLGFTSMQVSRYRRWMPGMRLFFSDATGQTTTQFTMTVSYYSQSAGYLKGYIDASNNGPIPRRWKITSRLLRVGYSGQNQVPLANGGLGSGNMFTKRNTMNAPTLSAMGEIFEDFNRYGGASPMTFNNTPYSTYRAGSLSNNGHYMNVAFPTVRNNTSGIILARTSSAGDRIGLFHNVASPYWLNASNEAEWQARIYIPTLSNGTNRYTLRIGMAATGSNWTTNPLSYGGFGFVYSDNINTGRWQPTYGQSGSISTIASATAVTTGWHTLRMTYSGGLLSFFANGVSLGTTSSNLPISNVLNLCSPFMFTVRDLGSITNSDWWCDYYWFRSKSTARQ